MKSSKAYIKSNYIKKAKIDWIYCDAQIIKQNNASLLKLSSINQHEDDREEIQSRNSDFSNHSTIHKNKSIVGCLKILLNLAEFKSCEIKPINFYNNERFAIKLVPTGILNSKKLYLVPADEEDLTKWCSVLGEYIYQNKETDSKNQKSKEIKSNPSIIMKSELSGKDSYSMNSPRKNFEKEIDEEIKLASIRRHPEKSEIGKCNDENISMTPNSPESCGNHKSEDIYFDIDDNDVYESSCSDYIYTVCVEESADSKIIGIRGSYLMKLKTESIELCDIKNGDTIHEFPYIFIRRFGAKNDYFRIEAGRKCSTGEGRFIFRFKDSAKAAEVVKDLVKNLKTSCLKSPTADQVSNGSKRNSATLSMSSTAFEYHMNKGIDEDHKVQFSDENNSSITESCKESISPLLSKVNTINNAATHSVTSNNCKPLHPLYHSISGVPPQNPSTASVSHKLSNGNSNSLDRQPMLNDNFNRNVYAASFSHRRPVKVNIPIIKDDSCSQSAIYDNIPAYETNSSNQYTFHSTSQSPTRTIQNQPSNVKFKSTYTLKGSLANTGTVTPINTDQYDNVPNNQRCIKELETMLRDLGIATK